MTRARGVRVVRHPGMKAVGMAVWGQVLMAVVASTCLGVGSAAAQTVLVRNVPPGTTVEFVLNATVVGSATADADGDASLRLRPAGTGSPEMDSFVFVDSCGARRRVLVVERGVEPAPQEPSCARVEIPGLFVVRPISTIVINATGPNPTLMLVQGPYDPHSPPRIVTPAPMGLVLSGGTGLTSFSKAGSIACGTAECSPDNWGLGLTGAAQFWLAPFLGAEVGYIKPGSMSANGSGTNYKFDSSLDGDVLTVAGLLGGPVGPLRLYGKAGANHQWSTFTTKETINDVTITVDDVPQTIPGGTQTITLRTSGWGWLFGGGMEVWVNSRFAIYGEAMWAGVKGGDADKGEGNLDERLTMFFVGGKVHIAFGR